MKKASVSRTAQYMALFRAMETARPADKRIFNDPYAVYFLDNGLKLVTALSVFSFTRRLIQKYIQHRIPGALSSGIARTKYIDDLMERSIKSGVKQVIILGAGFDTRALRLDCLKTIPVIEIDHPNTARLKMNKIKEVTGSLPASVKYYQIDFNADSLDNLAERNQINFSNPTTIIWEGVTNYLSKQAIESTFRFIGKFASGSFVIFTYVNQLILENPSAFYGGEKLLNDLVAIEEQWTFGLRPEEVPQFLKQFNLTLIEDAGATEYRTQYLPDCQHQGYEFYRVAFARKN